MWTFAFILGSLLHRHWGCFRKLTLTLFRVAQALQKQKTPLERSGRHSTSVTHENVEKLDQFMHEDHRATKYWCCLSSIRRKQPDTWSTKNWILLDDNAPSQRILLTHEFPTKANIVLLPNSPYSPDLVHADHHLFSKLEMLLKRRDSEWIVKGPRIAYRKRIPSWIPKVAGRLEPV